jgi:hypothetical protein
MAPAVCLTLCRDILNEKPTDNDLALVDPSASKGALPRGAIIHTTRGDIVVKLFPDECPKTVENFTTHASNAYYDNVIIHRVIKGFMIQTGDPDGMSGTNIPCIAGTCSACVTLWMIKHAWCGVWSPASLM